MIRDKKKNSKWWPKFAEKNYHEKLFYRITHQQSELTVYVFQVYFSLIPGVRMR